MIESTEFSQVNGQDVSLLSHKEVVELIKGSGNPLVLSLIQVSKNGE